MPPLIIMVLLCVFCFFFSVICSQKVLKIPEDQSYGVSGIITLFVYFFVSQILMHPQYIVLICGQECQNMVRFLLPGSIKRDVSKVQQLFLAPKHFIIEITKIMTATRIFLTFITFIAFLIIRFHRVKTVNSLMSSLERKYGDNRLLLQYFALRKMFPLTYKKKLLYSNLLRVNCEFCEIDLPYTTHYSNGQQRFCLCDYDHVCYWVNQKIYRQSISAFYRFLIAMLILCGVIMEQILVNFITFLVQIKESYELGIIKSIFPAVMMLDGNLTLEVVTFVVSLIIFIVALVQFIEQTRNVFSMFSKDDRKYLLDLSSQMKQGTYEKTIQCVQKKIEYGSQEYIYNVYEFIEDDEQKQINCIDLSQLGKIIQKDTKAWSIQKAIETLFY